MEEPGGQVVQVEMEEWEVTAVEGEMVETVLHVAANLVQEAKPAQVVMVAWAAMVEKGEMAVSEVTAAQ
jgi:hypothetical protein